MSELFIDPCDAAAILNTCIPVVQLCSAMHMQRLTSDSRLQTKVTDAGLETVSFFSSCLPLGIESHKHERKRASPCGPSAEVVPKENRMWILDNSNLIGTRRGRFTN